MENESSLSPRRCPPIRESLTSLNGRTARRHARSEPVKFHEAKNKLRAYRYDMIAYILMVRTWGCRQRARLRPEATEVEIQSRAGPDQKKKQRTQTKTSRHKKKGQPYVDINLEATEVEIQFRI